jgi:hypothetical protein
MLKSCMRFKQWLDKNTSLGIELAKRFDVSHSAVCQWATNGVPIKRMFGVQQFTESAVTVSEMVAESAETKSVV